MRVAATRSLTVTKSSRRVTASQPTIWPDCRSWRSSTPTSWAMRNSRRDQTALGSIAAGARGPRSALRLSSGQRRSVKSVLARPMLAKLRELIEGQAALAIGDHFKKNTGDTFDLDHISMAGCAQWSDTWILQRHRADPDLVRNDYHLEVEFSTRRSGGRSVRPVERRTDGEPTQGRWLHRHDQQSRRGPGCTSAPSPRSVLVRPTAGRIPERPEPRTTATPP